MDVFLVPTLPAWISIVREPDGEHYVYLEQRTLSPETLLSSTNQGLRFNTEEWSVFAIQV